MTNIATMTQFQKLFEPGRIGRLALRNRIVMPPMATNYATDTGNVSPRLIRYHAERARGGVGLIIVEFCCVDAPLGKAAASQLQLDHDRLVPGHSELVEAVHRYGAKIAVQLHHGGRVVSPRTTGGLPPVAPSAVALPDTVALPRELTADEVEALIEKFVAAAERAKWAGYDAVEVHGAHGYLVHQFMSEVTNRRTDFYGGSLENRMRFPTEIIRRIKQRVGRDFPVSFRMSAEGGHTIDDAKRYARLVAAAGADAIHVSIGGIVPTPAVPLDRSPQDVPEGWNVPFAEAIKREVAVPIITVNEIRSPEFAEGVLRDGRADFIALGRVLIADPEWPNKVAAGRLDDIRRCISCDYCLGCIRRSTFVRCAINPATGREQEFTTITPAVVRKRVMVVGGGPAGMEAARVAALRGHQVSLYEQAAELGGGQLKLAAATPHKHKLVWVRDDLATQIGKLNIDVILGRRVDAALVEQVAPDVLIVAAGARPIIPYIPGVEGTNVHTAEDVLAGRVDLRRQRVIVIGAGRTGCETAEFLAERGNTVTVVEQLDARTVMSNLTADSTPAHGIALLARLANHSVRLLYEHNVQAISDDGAVVMDKSWRETRLAADAVVLAVGATPVAELAEQARDKVAEVHVIGDGAEPRNIAAAIYEGTVIGRQI